MNVTITVRTAFGMVILSVLIAFGLGSAVTPVFHSWFPNTRPLYISFFSILIGQGFMVIPVVIYLRRFHIPLRSTLRLRKVSFQTMASVFIMAVGLVILMDELDRLAAMIVPLPDYLTKMNEALTFDSWTSALLLISALVILAPLGEEMLFRGFLQKSLEDGWGDITRAVLVTSLFFAFIHLNPYWIIQIYILAVMLGYLAWQADSIIPSFILHCVNNGIALAFDNVSDSFLEHYYLWHNHVALPWLIGSGILVYLGFRAFHATLEASL